MACNTSVQSVLFHEAVSTAKINILVIIVSFEAEASADYLLPHEVLSSRLVLTTIMMLQLPLRTHRALLHTHGAHANPTSFAFDSVMLIRYLLTTRLTFVALVA